MGGVQHAHSIVALAAVLLLVGGCRRTAPTAHQGPRAFDLNEAMQHWYGRWDASTRTARANLPDHPDVDLAGSWFAPKDPVDIVVIFEAGYDQSGHPRHVVITAAVPHRSDKPGRPGDDFFRCFSCQPVLGMAVFTRRLNTWVLESENEAVDLRGSRGLPPAVRIVPLGGGLHGVRLESHITASDFSSSSMSLLVPWQDDVERAFAGETGYSNSPACGAQSPLGDPCYAWQRSDRFADVPGQDYDDLVLTGSGTQLGLPAPASVRKPKKGEAHPAPAVVPYTAIERLRFREGQYLPLPETNASVPAH